MYCGYEDRQGHANMAPHVRQHDTDVWVSLIRLELWDVCGWKNGEVNEFRKGQMKEDDGKRRV